MIFCMFFILHSGLVWLCVAFALVHLVEPRHHCRKPLWQDVLLQTKTETVKLQAKAAITNEEKTFHFLEENNTEECLSSVDFSSLSKRLAVVETLLHKYLGDEVIEGEKLTDPLPQSLGTLLERMENMTRAYNRLDGRMGTVTSRLFSDGE